MLLGLAPGLKRRGIQVRVPDSLVLKESIEQLQGPSRVVETATQGPLQIHVPLQGGRKPRRKTQQLS